MKKFLKIFCILFIAISFFACNNKKKDAQQASQTQQSLHPAWSYNAVIYELNTRQFTPEGTLAAAQKHLDRLKAEGVDIIWLMPIHPIGVEGRKGELGSYYSVKNYKEVNPEFGSIEDLKNFVKAAHSKGMKVILDWVANHTSRDAEWLKSHKDWYVLDSLGEPAVQYDWTDIARLNYDKAEVRPAMIDAMMFWMRNTDIDGFRCDVAAEVPVDFWEQAADSVRAAKPDAFMLAEAEKPELHKHAFDMTYAWELHAIMNKIAQGKNNADSLRAYLSRESKKHPKSAFRMIFTSNHDENSWNGTEFERMGDAAKTFAALCYTLPGMPMMYNGQEAGFNRRLKFFVKDSIDWKDNDYTALYAKLGALRHNNAALQSGEKGGDLIELKTNNANVFAFSRTIDKNTVVAIFNLSNALQNFTADTKNIVGQYTDALTGLTSEIVDPLSLELKPWQFMILTK